MSATKIQNIDPTTITLEGNYCRYQDVADRHEQVVAKAVSIIENGQITPVKLNRVGDKLIPIAGTTRIAAVLLIRCGFTTGTEGQDDYKVYDAQLNLTVAAEVVELTEQEAAVQGFVENNERDQLTFVDIGRAAAEYGKRFGWTFKQITEKLRISDPNKVGQAVKVFNGYGKQVLDAVHSGLISPAAAHEPFLFTGNKRSVAQAAVRDAAKSGTKITASAVRKIGEEAPDEKPEAKDGQPATAAKKAKPKDRVRKGAEIREEFVGTLAQIDKLTPEAREHVPQSYIDTVKAFKDFVDGKIKGSTFFEKLDKAFGVPAKVWDDVVGSGE